MNNHKRILILSPHTDDAELGCGGSICKFLQQGHEIYWMVFSTCEESLPKNLPSDTLERECEDVLNCLNIRQADIHHLPVRRFSEYRQDILDSLIKIRDKFNPTLVIGPSVNDLHQDHIVIANEMVRAFKGSASILSYELPWNHLIFETQFFVKLSSEQIEKKIELLKFYKSQNARIYFSEYFTKGLALVRGAQVNNQYAESFEVIRCII